MSSPHQGDEPTPPADRPTSWGEQTTPPAEPPASSADHTQPLPPSPYLPYDSVGSTSAQPGHDPYGQAAHSSGPGPQHGATYPASPGTPPSSRRRGPGWAGAGAMTLAAALLAGGIGGIGGGLVAGGDDGGDGPSIVQRDGSPAQRPEGSTAEIAASAVPSVVTIRVSGGGSAGTGSGWVYDNSGHVVTNDHVVEAAGEDGRVRIELTDGTRRSAEIVGRDSAYDLAVLKVDPEGLDPLRIGRSDEVVVGDEVVAVGSPLGLGSTVTAGIVSALERPVTAGESGEESFISAIQTDTAINPGNSGGPLLNGNGDVVGVNTAIAQIPGQQQASGSIGLGFAIPSDVVVRTVDQLIETGEAEHPIIGVSLDRRWQGEGAKVLDEGDVQGGDAVIPGGPADDAGIEPGDVITEMDGRRITDLDQLIVRIRAEAVGDEVTLTVERDGEEQELTMTLEAAEEN